MEREILFASVTTLDGWFVYIQNDGQYGIYDVNGDLVSPKIQTRIFTSVDGKRYKLGKPLNDFSGMMSIIEEPMKKFIANYNTFA